MSQMKSLFFLAFLLMATFSSSTKLRSKAKTNSKITLANKMKLAMKKIKFAGINDPEPPKEVSCLDEVKAKLEDALNENNFPDVCAKVSAKLDINLDGEISPDEAQEGYNHACDIAGFGEDDRWECIQNIEANIGVLTSVVSQEEFCSGFKEVLELGIEHLDEIKDTAKENLFCLRHGINEIRKVIEAEVGSDVELKFRAGVQAKFDQLDLNGDGYISSGEASNEIKEIAEALGDKNSISADVEKELYEKYDMDQNGFDIEEFTAMTYDGLVHVLEFLHDVLPWAEYGVCIEDYDILDEDTKEIYSVEDYCPLPRLPGQEKECELVELPPIEKPERPERPERKEKDENKSNASAQGQLRGKGHLKNNASEVVEDIDSAVNTTTKATSNTNVDTRANVDANTNASTSAAFIKKSKKIKSKKH